ncbi:MAG: M23 family metallopeptidase [Eubacteriales bacterium]
MKLYFRHFLCVFLALILSFVPVRGADYIKWVDFTPTEQVLRDTLALDIETHASDTPIPMASSLACLAVRYGGDFRRYKKTDLEKIRERAETGEGFADIAANEKLFSYYSEAYGAVFDGMVCEYQEYTADGVEEKYGLCAYSPFAAGYYYSHYDDFGAARSFGYRRPHLGHDMMGSVGTPIVAVEAGYVEACGWNRFGGWRIGIRSFDGNRYYYYAHLRKNHPYADIYEGKIVAAGEVIGYLGMTGYSSKENTNNIDVPHLHWGLQLIFDKSQKDGNNQIWLDLYALTNFLEKYRAQTQRGETDSYSLTYKIPVGLWD